MTPYLFVFLMLPAGDVQAAIRTPSGTEITAKFDNSHQGTLKFVRWAAQKAKLTENAHINSCLAVAKGGDAQIYQTPFFEFADQATSNTVVWSEAALQASLPSVSGTERNALALLKPCAHQHHVNSAPSR